MQVKRPHAGACCKVSQHPKVLIFSGRENLFDMGVGLQRLDLESTKTLLLQSEQFH